MTRGHNHRKKDMTPEHSEKGKKARHDRLVQGIKQVLQKVNKYVMENPAGGLEKMWFMSDWQDKKKIIDLCSFAWPFKKTTNRWVEGFEFIQPGREHREW